MSGHSKWSTIKRKKGAIDAKRGKVFTRIIKELTIAARMGGGNPEANPRLRTAMAAAKAENMPKDNIERAIKKGSGELEGTTYEEITYEGYGPGGAAVLVDVMTDNKNRSAADIRNIFSKKGGNMAGPGSVSWMFAKKGFIMVKDSSADEDKVFTAALDSGAEDIKTESSLYEITTPVAAFEKVKNALEEASIEIESAEITMIPSNSIQIEGDDAKQVLALIDLLEDYEDVQNVYANFDIPDEFLEG